MTQTQERYLTESDSRREEEVLEKGTRELQSPPKRNGTGWSSIRKGKTRARANRGDRETQWPEAKVA